MVPALPQSRIELTADETAAIDAVSPRGVATAPGPMTPQWELAREAYVDLRSLGRQLTDAEARQQFDVACEKLAAAGHQALGVPGAPVLSPRELDVLACVAVGRSNADAAIELGIGVETVKSYLRSATRKLGSRSRLEAVVAARRLGLLP